MTLIETSPPLRVVLDAAEAWTSRNVRDWSPTLRENLESWLQPNLERVGDVDWGATGRRMTGLEIGTPRDWANRCIALADGHWAITGIRFRGLDLAKPFVDVIATSVAPSADGMRRLTELLPHYEDFSPLCLRVPAPDPQGMSAAVSSAALGAVTVDQLIVAGRVADMAARPPSADDTVALREIDADAAARRTAEIYAELAQSRPGISEWATPEDEESLAECAEEGLLFEVLASGGSAGILALARDDSFGLRGHCVQEICIEAEHRGRRIGSAALRETALLLPEGGDVLWGHIHPRNEALLRNARAAGRQVVGANLWFAPNGYPGMPG